MIDALEHASKATGAKLDYKLYREYEGFKIGGEEASLKAETIEKEKTSVLENYELEKTNIKDEMQQKENEIEDLKKELQTTNSDKYVEIESLKDERDAKANEVNALKQKLEALEETLSEAKGAPQLMEEIKGIMAHKGFLSDKEFDDLIEKIENT